MRKHGRYLVSVLVCVIVPAALYAADKVLLVNSDHVGGTVQIVGRFGMPIGRFITIEGKRAMTGKGGNRTLLVEKIDGKQLEKPIGIWVDNVKILPEDATCILKGYETGGMIGTPDDVREKTGASHGQARWQFHVKFLVSEVVSPTSLQKD